MLKYKIHSKIKIISKLPVYNSVLDSRVSYIDYHILNILNFSYKIYKKQIELIKQSGQDKIRELKKLNNILLIKKHEIKILLSQNKFNPAITQKTNIFIKSIEQETIKEYLFGMDITINKYANEEQINKEYRQEKKEYGILLSKLNNINNDIRLINNLKKDINSLYGYYLNINITYSDKAKITLYDIQQAGQGILTNNAKNILYFYLIKLKKVTNRTGAGQDLKNLFPCLNEQVINSIIKKSIKKSFNIYLSDSLNKRLSCLKSAIINKWV